MPNIEKVSKRATLDNVCREGEVVETNNDVECVQNMNSFNTRG
jgi:hypothetical protein